MSGAAPKGAAFDVCKPARGGVYNSYEMSLLKAQKTENPEAQMELMDHLAELRTRIVRSLCYVALGMVLTYALFDQLFALLYYPLEPIIKKIGGSIFFPDIASAFLLRMQICLVSGLAAAFPFVLLEMWGFITPALTLEERRPVVYLAPFSVLLFLAGILTGYACLPATFSWMASFVGDVKGATLMQDAQKYVVLTVKIMLGSGIAFQLPIVLLFLARVGIITSGVMVQYWRHAIVLIALAAAFITPSADPLTMMIIAIPMGLLYVLSIGLVKTFEPRPDGTTAPRFATLLLVALTPVVILAAVGYWLWRTRS